MIWPERSERARRSPALPRTRRANVAWFCALMSYAAACNSTDDRRQALEDVAPLAAASGRAQALGDAGAAGLYAGLSDGQIWFVIDTIQAGEVDQARAALPRLARDAVRDFARDMIAEHEPNRDRLLRLADDEDIDPVLSDEAARLRRRNELALLELLRAGPLVDALYVAAEAASHGEAVQLFEALMNVADSEILREELAELRARLTIELNRIEELARGHD